MDTENRRSFVKKSLATSVTISFSGLIRAAHGETVETTTQSTAETTIDQWSDEITDTLGLNSDYTSGFELTFPNEYTINQWSAWSIDPVTDPPTTIAECQPGHHRYLLQPPVQLPNGDYHIPQRVCAICGHIEEYPESTTSEPD